MRLICRVAAAAFGIALLPHAGAHAFEVATHARMAYQVVNLQRARFSALQTLLGSQDGLIDPIGGLPQGARDEDEPSGRVLNHFHEPISNAGFIGGVSSTLWALSEFQGNAFSWGNAQIHLLGALINDSATARANELAQVYETLGHQIHLVQDATSPPHVRNDNHLDLTGFGIPIALTAFDHVRITPEVVDDNRGMVRPRFRLFDSIGLGNPAASLWDINFYTDEASCGSLGLGEVGVAEYVASHFFSDRTVPLVQCYWNPADPTQAQCTNGVVSYPCPRVEDLSCDPTGACSLNAPDGQRLENILYRDPLGFYAFTPENADSIAPILVPLAIGYSAELVDYFFRGIIDHGSTTPAVDVRLDPTPPPPGEPPNLLITNNSPDTWEAGGILSIYTDDPPPSEARQERYSQVLDADVVPGASLPVALKPELRAAIPSNGQTVVVYQGPTRGGEESVLAARVCSCKNGQDDGDNSCTGLCGGPVTYAFTGTVYLSQCLTNMIRPCNWVLIGDRISGKFTYDTTATMSEVNGGESVFKLGAGSGVGWDFNAPTLRLAGDGVTVGMSSSRLRVAVLANQDGQLIAPEFLDFPPYIYPSSIQLTLCSSSALFSDTTHIPAVLPPLSAFDVSGISCNVFGDLNVGYIFGETRIDVDSLTQVPPTP